MMKGIFILAGLTFYLALTAQTVVWQAQAEDGTLSGATEVVEGCANASGGFFVKLSNKASNTVSFNNIELSKAGNYKLSVYHFNASPVDLVIEVNGNSLGTKGFPAGVWCYQGSAIETVFDVELSVGTNSILLRPEESLGSPLLDRLVLIDESGDFKPQKYYVSSSSGNDTNAGTSPEAPWASLARASDQLLNPGDSVLFKSGDTFIGQLQISRSGTKDMPLYFGKYGEGDLPVLDGALAEGGAHLATVAITNHDNIELAFLEITNDRQTSRAGVSDNLAYGIDVQNTGPDTLRNYHFHDLTVRDIFAPTTENQDFNAIKVSAINFFTSKNTEVGKERNIQDVLVENCYIARTTRLGIKTGHAGGDEGVGNDSINRNMNLVFRNNHFYQTGGTCILPTKTYNCLIEHNIFEEPGSDADPRMANRGSSVWFFSSRNGISQYNKCYSVRGYADSYSQHIDFGNRNIIMQYNYSEDSEGGFVEILGDNVNSTYRFNVSVNDGFRDFKGNTLWVSAYAGKDRDILSDSSFIYNNSVYVDAAITPDISFVGKNIFVYNNIFQATGAATIGQEVTMEIEPGSQLYMSNNLYYGNITSTFKNYDSSPVNGNPLYVNGGGLTSEDYRVTDDSPAINAGKQFPEPVFPMAGKGIFKDIAITPNVDMFGNPVGVSDSVPNIGADNRNNSYVGIHDLELVLEESMTIYPNPVEDQVMVTVHGVKKGKVSLVLSDIKGTLLQQKEMDINPNFNQLKMTIDPDLRNGIYILSIEEKGKYVSKKVVIYR
ncbi:MULTISPECIES: T9SS type A sorting domain-containing protein [unclassified Carboxylicivirga]|uniref:T9SS type A sorting domain-containing protein n=1 Tax=Carboxylicivirga TaxID=1628153 RepID=UPI003D346EA7